MTTRSALVRIAESILLAACAVSVSAQEIEIQSSPPFSSETLSALPTTGWLTNGGNLFNQRHSPLTQIDRRNVAPVDLRQR